MSKDFEKDFWEKEKVLMKKSRDFISVCLEEARPIKKYNVSIIDSVGGDIEAIVTEIHTAGGINSDNGRLIFDRFINLTTNEDAQTTLAIKILSNL